MLMIWLLLTEISRILIGEPPAFALEPVDAVDAFDDPPPEDPPQAVTPKATAIPAANTTLLRLVLISPLSGALQRHPRPSSTPTKLRFRRGRPLYDVYVET
jgi:hypothetical protein